MYFERIWRLALFIALLLITLALSAGLVLFAIMFAQDMGWVRIAPLEVTAHAVVTAILGITGLVGVAVAYDRGLRESQAVRARFVFDLTGRFLEDDRERDFFYKLDYQDFVFDPSGFAQSTDELHLDRLLYKLTYVGKLLRDGLVSKDDLGSIRHIASRTLRNPEVIKYLRYLKEEQIPDHSSFSDSIYLFEQWFGKKDPAYPEIRRYLSPTSPLPYTAAEAAK
jgi:hypothetical protein